MSSALAYLTRASAGGELECTSTGEGPCDVILASDLVALDAVAVPPEQRKRLTPAAMRFLVEHAAIAEPEQLHVAGQPGADRQTLHVAIVDRPLLARALERLRRAGLSPASARPETLLVDLAPGAWTVVWNGRDGFVRTGELSGFALDRPATGVPIALVLALRRAREAGHAPRRIVIRSAGDAPLPDLRAWAAELQLAVDAGPGWSWRNPERAPRLDLLQGEFAAGAAPGTRSRLRRLAWLSLAILVVNVAAFGVDWGIKAYERGQLATQARAILAEALGAGVPALDPPLQMRRALDERRLRAGEASPADFIALLPRIVDRLPESARERVRSMEYGAGKLSVLIDPRDEAESRRFMEALRASARGDGIEVRLEPGSPGSLIRMTATAQR